jgi:5-hydroxyisourate hydrolase-like protein (transthyretin family)
MSGEYKRLLVLKGQLIPESKDMAHKETTLSSHVLDTATGTPAKGMNMVLEKQQDMKWIKVSQHAYLNSF